MYLSSMSLTCGRWPLPQQMWKRIWSSGRPSSAWLMTSTQNSRYLRYSSTRPVRVEDPGGAELRLVDLEDEAGVGDRLVLLADGLGDGHHVLLFARVVLVADAGAQAQRPERGDEALDVLALERRLEVGESLLMTSWPVYVTGPVQTALGGRRAGRARREEAGPDRAARAGEPQAGGVEAGEVAAVALGDAGALRRLVRVDRHRLPAGHALLDVAAVAAGLDVLAVVDDVDAALDLAVDDLSTALGSRFGYSSVSPCRPPAISLTSSGRGRLPACETRIRSVLCFKTCSLALGQV